MNKMHPRKVWLQNFNNRQLMQLLQLIEGNCLILLVFQFKPNNGNVHLPAYHILFHIFSGCMKYSFSDYFQCLCRSRGMLFWVLSWSRPQIWGGGQGKFRGNGCWGLLLYLTAHSSSVPFSKFWSQNFLRERAQREDSSNRGKEDQWSVQTLRYWS